LTFALGTELAAATSLAITNYPTLIVEIVGRRVVLTAACAPEELLAAISEVEGHIA
jgi:hypothetical protein